MSHWLTLKGQRIWQMTRTLEIIYFCPNGWRADDIVCKMWRGRLSRFTSIVNAKATMVLLIDKKAAKSPAQSRYVLQMQQQQQQQLSHRLAAASRNSDSSPKTQENQPYLNSAVRLYFACYLRRCVAYIRRFGAVHIGARRTGDLYIHTSPRTCTTTAGACLSLRV